MVEYFSRGLTPDLSKMKKKEDTAISMLPVEPLIKTIRGQKVILDSELAKIYGVPTFRFNEVGKRNRSRFPDDFMFQLTHQDVVFLRSQIAISKNGRGGRRARLYAFTEHGAVMAANILKSSRDVQMSITGGLEFRQNGRFKTPALCYPGRPVPLPPSVDAELPTGSIIFEGYRFNVSVR